MNHPGRYCLQRSNKGPWLLPTVARVPVVDHNDSPVSLEVRWLLATVIRGKIVPVLPTVTRCQVLDHGGSPVLREDRHWTMLAPDYH